MIKVTKDIKLREEVTQALLENDGYCPCKIQHIKENKCMCDEFMKQESGPCSCGLYYKE